jgi:cyclomaltodextrin glucanotransferase
LDHADRRQPGRGVHRRRPRDLGRILADKGKAGYHGYWSDNFYVLDEHLPSKGLDFKRFADGMHRQGLKVVLDIVANHGSPAFGMETQQPKYGQLFAKDGRLLADHQNLKPAQLDPAHNPLHRFYKTELELAQLSNLDENNPEVFEYLSGAYLQWIDQGADAFRVDTIKYMPPEFWKRFADRMRSAARASSCSARRSTTRRRRSRRSRRTRAGTTRCWISRSRAGWPRCSARTTPASRRSSPRCTWRAVPTAIRTTW